MSDGSAWGDDTVELAGDGGEEVTLRAPSRELAVTERDRWRRARWAVATLTMVLFFGALFVMAEGRHGSPEGVRREAKLRVGSPAKDIEERGSETEQCGSMAIHARSALPVKAVDSKEKGEEGKREKARAVARRLSGPKAAPLPPANTEYKPAVAPRAHLGQSGNRQAPRPVPPAVEFGM